MSKKWYCPICSTIFPTKKELVEDLKSEYEESAQNVDIVVDLLKILGVKETELSY